MDPNEIIVRELARIHTQLAINEVKLDAVLRKLGVAEEEMVKIHVTVQAELYPQIRDFLLNQLEGREGTEPPPRPRWNW